VFGGLERGRLFSKENAMDVFQDTGPSDLDRVSPIDGKLSDGAKAFISQFVPTDDDRSCIVAFDVRNEFMTFKSREASEKKGEPVEIYEPVVFINITVRGNDKLEVDRPVSEADKRRFPYAWQEFKRGEQLRARGVPLMKLGLEASQIRGMAAKNVFTIEDMAEVDDNNLQNLGTGAREFRSRAREYLKTHKAADASSSEIEQLKAANAAQADQLAKALEAIAKLSEKRGPGRPPKVETE
jgi:hypothetical protein